MQRFSPGQGLFEALQFLLEPDVVEVFHHNYCAGTRGGSLAADLMEARRLACEAASLLFPTALEGTSLGPFGPGPHRLHPLGEAAGQHAVSALALYKRALRQAEGSGSVELTCKRGMAAAYGLLALQHLPTAGSSSAAGNTAAGSSCRDAATFSMDALALVFAPCMSAQPPESDAHVLQSPPKEKGLSASTPAEQGTALALLMLALTCLQACAVDNPVACRRETLRLLAEYLPPHGMLGSMDWCPQSVELASQVLSRGLHWHGSATGAGAASISSSPSAGSLSSSRSGSSWDLLGSAGGAHSKQAGSGLPPPLHGQPASSVYLAAGLEAAHEVIARDMRARGLDPVPLLPRLAQHLASRTAVEAALCSAEVLAAAAPSSSCSDCSADPPLARAPTLAARRSVSSRGYVTAPMAVPENVPVPDAAAAGEGAAAADKQPSASLREAVEQLLRRRGHSSSGAAQQAGSAGSAAACVADRSGTACAPDDVSAANAPAPDGSFQAAAAGAAAALASCPTSSRGGWGMRQRSSAGCGLVDNSAAHQRISMRPGAVSAAGAHERASVGSGPTGPGPGPVAKRASAGSGPMPDGDVRHAKCSPSRAADPTGTSGSPAGARAFMRTDSSPWRATQATTTAAAEGLPPRPQDVLRQPLQRLRELMLDPDRHSESLPGSRSGSGRLSLASPGTTGASSPVPRSPRASAASTAGGNPAVPSTAATVAAALGRLQPFSSILAARTDAGAAPATVPAPGQGALSLEPGRRSTTGSAFPGADDPGSPVPASSLFRTPQLQPSYLGYSLLGAGGLDKRVAVAAVRGPSSSGGALLGLQLPADAPAASAPATAASSPRPPRTSSSAGAGNAAEPVAVFLAAAALGR